MKANINYVIPFGNQCISAFYLKENNLKLLSYPFDWIFCNPSIINDMIDDNFKKFLDKDNYVIKDSTSEKNKHSIYLPDLYLFNHRNPIKDDDYLYFLRCIERFYNVLKKKETKLFLITILNNEIKNELENICILHNKLSNITENYELLCIFQQKSDSGIQSKEVYINENLTIIQLCTIDESDGVIFLNDDDSKLYKDTIDELYEFNLNPIDF